MQLLLRAARSLSERYSVAMGVRASWDEPRGASGVVSAQLSGRLGSRFSFRLGVERASGGELVRDTRLVLGIAMLFDRARQSVQFDADTFENLQSTHWRADRGGMHGGYNATLGASDGDFGSNADAALRLIAMPARFVPTYRCPVRCPCRALTPTTRG